MKLTWLKKELYLIRQDNIIYKCWIKLSFSSIGQDKSKLQKQGEKRMLFNKTRQYSIHIFNKFIFFNDMTRQIKATKTNK